MLPRLVEYIQSLGFMGSGLSIDPIVTQVNPAAGIAAGANVTYRLNPVANQPYAIIVHKVSFGAAIVPGVFTADILQAGHFAYSPTITATVIRDSIEMFVVSTNAVPMTIKVTNNSLLIQNYEHIVYGTQIGSREDYDKVIASLRDLARADRHSLTVKAIEALEKMGVR